MSDVLFLLAHSWLGYCDTCPGGMTSCHILTCYELFGVNSVHVFTTFCFFLVTSLLWLPLFLLRYEGRISTAQLFLYNQVENGIWLIFCLYIHISTNLPASTSCWHTGRCRMLMRDQTSRGNSQLTMWYSLQLAGSGAAQQTPLVLLIVH